MKSRRSNRSLRSKRTKRSSQKKFSGGRTNLDVPTTIKYTKGNNAPIALTCPKCNNGTKFIAKTLTMGTKTKAFFNLEILDNRFKIFQCAGCGFAQMYSNEVTCNDKECDPVF